MGAPRCGSGLCILNLTDIAETSSIVNAPGLNAAETAQELRISVRKRSRKTADKTRNGEFAAVRSLSVVERDVRSKFWCRRRPCCRSYCRRPR